MTTTFADDARWLHATYRVRATPAAIDARAQSIAHEQSVELPLAAVTDERVLREVVARVASIRAVADDTFDVTLQIAVETTNAEAGQLLNMLFGNSSLHEDLALIDVDFPPAFARRFGGPRYGIAGLRAVTGVHGRALMASALKPQGLLPAQLAALAGVFARAGIDVVKDDHGLADQASAPFDTRVREVQRAIDAANRETGGNCVYAPSLTGHYGQIRLRAATARDAGVRMLMIAPMVSGVASLAALAQDVQMPILAHPAMAGGARIAPPLLLGKLFRLFGADAAIFPNHGGRFGYSAQTCTAIAGAARGEWQGIAPAMPVPAGGMSVARVAEMRARYGEDTMLLIGGDLLLAGDALAARCREFVASVGASGEVR
ncbi:MAG TPA: RuBisCO large subunit C-terminal-like domain-containing protein [Casimicrobiaceae bacterium]